MTEANNSAMDQEPVKTTAAPASAEVAFDSLAGANLKTGELPNRLAPGVSRWMTWGFVLLLFSVPVTQSALEIKRGSWPQMFKVFTRLPLRRHLEAYEKRLEENSFVKQYVQPRVQKIAKTVLPHVDKAAPDAGQGVPSRLVQVNVDGTKTPFVQWVEGTGAGLVLHPFIDFTHCSGPPESQLDYFGFRNPIDYYFARPEGKLVVITGNSEVMGSTHKRPIALRLEEYLNSHTNDKWHVVNLAMNGYTVPTEINAYVHLAYHLRPDVVISHSLGSDLYFGLMVPMEYKKLGLYYYKAAETWYPQVRGITVQGAGKWEVLDGGHDLLADGYLRNARKYRDIVKQNGGRFILGLQKCDPEAGPNVTPAQRKEWNVVLQLYGEVHAKIGAQQLEYIDFSKVDGLKCVDPIHTTDDSAQIIAEMYGAQILRAPTKKDGNGPFKVVSSPK